MNVEKLSRRLESVYNYIPKGSKVADIGSDHAYLPCYAIKTGRAVSAIAGEVVEGPYQSAVQQVAKTGLQDKIDVRKGDGLEVLSSGEADCITIAGMGGALIASILEKGKDKLEHTLRLILQPNIAADVIRSWCLQNEWKITAEEILEEDGKIYEIIVADRVSQPSEKQELSELEILMGPFLLREMSVVFMKKWSQEITQWKNVLNQLDKAQTSPDIQKKKQELNKKIQLAEGVIK